MKKAMKKMNLFSKSWAWLCNRIVFSKTIFFIWGLILSYGFTTKGLVGVLMDYFSDLYENELQKATIIVSVVTGLSSTFGVVAYILAFYVGRFNVIIFCASSSVIGIMLLKFSTRHSNEPTDSLFPMAVALILIAFGDAMESTLRDFLDYQLEQKVKQRPQTTHTGSQRNQNGQDVDYSVIWWKSAYSIGSVIGSLSFAQIHDWSKKFNITVLVMLGAYLWFYSGCPTYSFEEPNGSSYKMYRVFKAALWKWKVNYPTSEEEYHRKNLSKNGLYYKGPSIRLKPHVPSFWRWLDKAAIIKDRSPNNKIEEQEKIGALCSVQEVRELKLVVSMTHFALSLLPCTFLKVTADTFFIEQSSGMKYANYISGLLVLQFFSRELVVLLFWWFKKLQQQKITILRIGIGMICAVLCCFVAWRVEAYRQAYSERWVDSEKKLSIAILIPQYCLLGITEGLAVKGFENFFYNRVPESMGNLGLVIIEFVYSIGCWLTLLFICSNTIWFQYSINQSQIAWYYFLLGILNIVALPIYGYYFWTYSKENGTAEDEESMTERDDGAQMEPRTREDSNVTTTESE